MKMPNNSIVNHTRKSFSDLDDENVRYKINMEYYSNKKSPKVVLNRDEAVVNNKYDDEDDGVRYKLGNIVVQPKSADKKVKPKPKIKVNFWSNKVPGVGTRLHNNEAKKSKVSRRHTLGTSSEVSPKKQKNLAVKVRKRVSFLPSPLFSDNHIPMVTVPDDLTIQLNEEEANDLGEDLNQAFVKSNGQTSPRNTKRKRNSFDTDSRNPANEYELEFFSKYVVQKLRRMETNQRIYSENLINTVLMLGQLGKLSGKSRINDL